MKKGLKLVTYSAMVLGALAMGTETASAAEWTARTPEQIEITDGSKYLIIWGDTLWAISEASGVSVDALVEMNQIANRDLIYAGNTLVINGNKVTVTEQNGEKSSFIVVDETVTPTNDHVEGTTPTQTGDDKGGNFSAVDGKSDVKQNANTEVPKVVTPNVEQPKAETPSAETPKGESPKGETPKVETPKVDAPKVEDNKDTEDDGGGNFTVETPNEEKPSTPSTPVAPEKPATPELPAIDKSATVEDFGDLGWAINLDLSMGYSKANPLTFPQYAFPGSQFVSVYVEGNNIVFNHAEQGSKTFPLSGGKTTYNDVWYDTVDVIDIIVRSYGEVTPETPEVPVVDQPVVEEPVETPVETPEVDEAAEQEARASEAIVGLRGAVSGPYDVSYVSEGADVPGNVFVSAVQATDAVSEGFDSHEELVAARQAIVNYMTSKGHKLVFDNYGMQVEDFFTIAFQVD